MSEVNSTSDARVLNNTVRHQYRVLSDSEKALMLSIKDAGQGFLELLEAVAAQTRGFGGSRELSIAKTKIEEAVMWAVKHVTS
jgi:hypothetical protein